MNPSKVKLIGSDIVTYTGKGFDGFDSSNRNIEFISYQPNSMILGKYNGQEVLVPANKIKVPDSVTHTICGTKSKLNIYEHDNTTCYYCKKCDNTFINNDKQTIMS